MSDHEAGYTVRPIYVARDIGVAGGKLVDSVEPPGIRNLSDLAAMIGLSHPEPFVLPGKSHWFLVYSESESDRLHGYVEIIEEVGAKWSYGHIHVINPDAAKAIFSYIRESASMIGRTIDDLHPDHEWYAH